MELRRGRPVLPTAAWRAALPPSTQSTQRRPTRRYRFALAGRRRVLEVDGSSFPCPTVRAAQDALEGDLALHVAASSPSYVFIHAGVVGWQGRALLLPGRTFAGKSTLVAALLRAGGSYYSDEYALLDGAGLVHPYPRRMSLRRAKGVSRRVRPRTSGRRPLPVGWVLGVKYEAGSETAIELITPGRTALLLLDNAVAARVAPQRVLAGVRRASVSSIGARAVRGDADLFVKDLLPLLRGQGIVQHG